MPTFPHFACFRSLIPSLNRQQTAPAPLAETTALRDLAPTSLPSPAVNQTASDATLSLVSPNMRLHNVVTEVATSIGQIDTTDITVSDLLDWLDTDEQYDQLQESEIMMRGDFSKCLMGHRANKVSVSTANNGQAIDENPIVQFPGTKLTRPKQLLADLGKLIHEFTPNVHAVRNTNITSTNAQGLTLQDIAKAQGLIEIDRLLDALIQNPLSALTDTQLIGLLGVSINGETTHPLITQHLTITRLTQTIAQLSALAEVMLDLTEIQPHLQNASNQLIELHQEWRPAIELQLERHMNNGLLDPEVVIHLTT